MFHAFGNNPITYTDPDGRSVKSALELIKKHKGTIKIVASAYEVDPVGIASVIFQEKYHGSFADLKDSFAYFLDGGVNDNTCKTRSYGLAEMQLTLAAELLGEKIEEPGTPKKIYDYLNNDAVSIMLIAANIKKNEDKLNKKLQGYNAAIAHNMGAKGYLEFFFGKRDISPVAARSVNYQSAINDALNGVINAKKDNER